MSVLLPEDHRDCAKGILDKKVLNSAGRPLPMVKVRIITEKAMRPMVRPAERLRSKALSSVQKVCPYRAPEQKTGIILPEI